MVPLRRQMLGYVPLFLEREYTVFMCFDVCITGGISLLKSTGSVLSLDRHCHP
jgi:hypothetical protein